MRTPTPDPFSPLSYLRSHLQPFPALLTLALLLTLTSLTHADEPGLRSEPEVVIAPLPDTEPPISTWQRVFLIYQGQCREGSMRWDTEPSSEIVTGVTEVSCTGDALRKALTPAMNP